MGCPSRFLLSRGRKGQHLGVALTPTSLLKRGTDSMCFHVEHGRAPNEIPAWSPG